MAQYATFGLLKAWIRITSHPCAEEEGRPQYAEQPL